MKVLALSDIHENTKHLNRLIIALEKQHFEPDIAVIAGDITRFKGVEAAKDILKILKSALGVQILFVPGNCDSPQLLDLEYLLDGVINIHAKAYKHGNYTFFGVGGGGLSPFHTYIEFSEEEFEELIKKALSYVDENLIIVTHEPILGYFDEVGNTRIGSRVFASYLERLKPVAWITGHVHENSGWMRVGSTVVVHPGPFMRGFYAVLEVINREVVYVNVANVRQTT